MLFSFQVHVDCFLYDEDDIEDLVEQGKLTRTYCLDCGSKNTKPLTFISHSLAPAQVVLIYCNFYRILVRICFYPACATKRASRRFQCCGYRVSSWSRHLCSWPFGVNISFLINSFAFTEEVM